MRFPRVVVG